MVVSKLISMQNVIKVFSTGTGNTVETQVKVHVKKYPGKGKMMGNNYAICA